ncbi:hypothetical protein R4J03_06715 [Brachyspira intermedia]|uniref:hypothetical protein n=1 Tax=Brachyspira intermedia TaxID=84377 RepID=UPI002603A018|nr:hypothetical protein [uncultured Brachyspira sp.]
MKKFLLMLLMSASAFAAGGFELAVNVPVLVSVGLPLGNGEKRKVDAYGSSGITVQLGYGAYYENGLGFSILGELGYAYSSFANYYPNRPNKEVTTMAFDTFQLGVLPKFNMDKFSIGLGAGVKIPFSGQIIRNNEYSSSEYSIHYTDIDFRYIQNSYNKMWVIPYIKLTFDFYTDSFGDDSSTTAGRSDVGIGLYLGYDFGPKDKNNVGSDSFNIGAQFSYRLKPINFDK